MLGQICQSFCCCCWLPLSLFTVKLDNFFMLMKNYNKCFITRGSYYKYIHTDTCVLYGSLPKKSTLYPYKPSIHSIMTFKQWKHLFKNPFICAGVCFLQ